MEKGLKGLFVSQADFNGLPWWLSGKESACQCRRCRFSITLGWVNPLQDEMATCTSILAWNIPWTAEPGRLHVVHGVTNNQM